MQSKDRELFEAFQKRWSLEKVKAMILEGYTRKESKETFTYDLEHNLRELGSIRGVAGGLGNLKFGICHCDGSEYKVKRKHFYSKDKQYAWLSEYGDENSDPKEVFENIKSKIVEIIEHKDDLNRIESVDLPHLLKWKIAFHYQNPDNMKVVCIFTENTLKKIAEGENLGSDLNTAQIYQKLLENKTYTLETMMEKAKDLWEKYGESKEALEQEENNEIRTLANENTTQGDFKNSTLNQKIPLNQILYGPPGTGKTYSTIDKALEILLEYKQINFIPESREEKRKRFDEYKKQGQIEFITFHQSFSYEEFVEGIKPDVISSNEIEDSSNMIYILKDGAFKRICEKALDNYIESAKPQNQLKSEQNTKELIDTFLENMEKDFDNEEKISLDYRNWCMTKIGEGNIMRTYRISENRWIKLESDTVANEDWISVAAILANYDNFKNTPENEQKYFTFISSRGNPHSKIEKYRAVFQKIQAFENSPEWKEKQKILDISANYVDNTLKPYILIIDEINRGNISKILGELITLIEPSKRIGNSEELQVTLPYSNELFGVPKNLYIIATMNTADRSIALLDTALRRRFEFIEMMPKPEILSENCEGVNLQKLLDSINKRIEFLLDREHTIGHSFFIKTKNLEDLKSIFIKKILPLLQEYFYEDYAKIDAVLNANGMIESKEYKVSSVFTNLKNNDLDLEDKKIYKITESSVWNEETFKKIYK